MDTKGLVRALGEESLLRHVGDMQHVLSSKHIVNWQNFTLKPLSSCIYVVKGFVH